MLLHNTTVTEPLVGRASLSEMSYLADKLNVPVQEIRRAVEAVGNDGEKIRQFLYVHGNRG